MEQPTPAVEFRILGPLEVVVAGEPVALGPAQQRAVLALLVVHAPQPLSRDRLIDELWGERPPPTAAHAVQVHISGIRKALGGVAVRSSPLGYVLDVDPEGIDARRFERLVGEARQLADTPAAEMLLERALALWRGAPLPEIAGSELGRREAERLQELHSSALEGALEVRVAAGDHDQPIGRLRSLVAAEPLRERPRRLLMLALYRAGRHAEALAAYRDAAAALDEVGLQPGPELRQLEAAILRHEPSLAPAEPAVHPVDPSPPAPPPDRRKTITALACRITTAELDPEALRGAMSRCIADVREAVEQHGGTLDTMAGDAAIAVFGSPRVREDDALRAVRAAVEIRARWRSPLGLSAALSTGLALVRDADDLAVSAPITAAMRLAGAAGRGEILLAAETLRLVRDAVQAEPRPGLGTGFRLLELDPTAPALARDFERPLVGRQRELERLREAWDRTLGESGCHLYTVLGPAGVGKSRLIIELLRWAGESATVLSGRCLHYGDGITFWPLLEALSPMGEITAGVRARLAAGGVATPEELFWEVRRLLETLAAARPLILHVDDLQWAQPMLLDLLDHVVELSRSAPILVLCAARQELFDARPSWGGGKLNATAALLEPLAPDACARLLDELGDGLAADARARVIGASDGNPLFLEELAALAREHGTVAMPPTIQAVLAARLEGLADHERTLLERGAVEGEVFHRGAVAALTGLDATVDRTLAGLVRKDLVRPHSAALAGDDAYRFRHILIRDAAYDGLPKAARAELHERLAGWLEEHGGALAELDEIAGWHLEQAAGYRRELSGGRVDGALARRAAEHLHAAGRRARERTDVAAARNLLDRAHALAAGPLRALVAVDLAEQLIEGGDLSRADELLTAVEHDPDVTAQALLTRFEWCQSARPEEFHAGIECALPKILADLTRAGDERGLARARLLAYWVEMSSARSASGAEQALLAAEHARRVNDEGLRSRALGLYLGTVVNSSKDRAAITRDLRTIESQGSGAYLSAFLDLVRGELARMAGRADDARRFTRDSVDQFRAMGQHAYAGATQSLYIAQIELSCGQPERALPDLLEADATLAALGERAFRSTAQAALADIYESVGDRERAHAALTLCDELTTEGDVWDIVITGTVRARLALSAGESETAERWARRAVEHALQTDFTFRLGNAEIELARFLAARGRHDEAAAHARAALEVFEAKGDRPRAEIARALLGAEAPAPVRR